MPAVAANGIQIHYELGGEGQRLLFISGTGGDLRNRPNVFDGPLTEHFEVLSYDQRGLGQSEKPETDYTMADYADDAAALIHSMGWATCHVLGSSFGGMVALNLAIRHPEVIDRLVLCCTSPGGDAPSYPLHELASMDPEIAFETRMRLLDRRWDLDRGQHLLVAVEELGVLVEGAIEVRHVGRVVAVVVDLHGARVDVRLEGVVVVLFKMA